MWLLPSMPTFVSLAWILTPMCWASIMLCEITGKAEINAAKRGLINPQVNIHIFSGLSGGTGAGCFLDVCYMVKNVANSVGGITTFGYFFLPDVNLEKIPISDTATRAYIPQRGF